MIRSFSFHPDARTEFREAAKFYESSRRGVGSELSREVRRAIDQTLEHPMSGSPGPAGTRQLILRHFPYSLFYLFEGSEITIVALAHQRRRPEYWRDRLKSR